MAERVFDQHATRTGEPYKWEFMREEILSIRKECPIK